VRVSHECGIEQLELFARAASGRPSSTRLYIFMRQASTSLISHFRAAAACV
jgi:hypothetical protein